MSAKVYKLDKNLKFKPRSGKVKVKLVRYGVTATYDQETAERMIREGKAVRA